MANICNDRIDGGDAVDDIFDGDRGINKIISVNKTEKTTF